MSKAEPFSQAGASLFLTTHWSVVRDAGGDVEASGTRRAREALCRAYWRPVVALLASRGLQRADAEDVAQDFFQRLLSGDRLARISSEGGRFRMWLRQAVENFRISAYRRRIAAKRGGGAAHLPEHEARSVEPPASVVPGMGARTAHARDFDRAWANAVVDAAVAALRERCVREGQERAFETLVACALPGGSTMGGDALAAGLGATPAAARKALERFRRRFRDALRAQVALTVSDPTTVEDELRYLRSMLAG